MKQPKPSSSTCPLCAKDNQCAMAAGREAETCWCWHATIDPAARERAADAADTQCICASCGQGVSRSEADEG